MMMQSRGESEPFHLTSQASGPNMKRWTFAVRCRTMMMTITMVTMMVSSSQGAAVLKDDQVVQDWPPLGNSPLPPSSPPLPPSPPSPRTSWLMFINNSNVRKSSRKIDKHVLQRPPRARGPPAPRPHSQQLIDDLHGTLTGMSSKMFCVLCECRPRISASFFGRLPQVVRVARRSLVELRPFSQVTSFQNDPLDSEVTPVTSDLTGPALRMCYSTRLQGQQYPRTLRCHDNRILPAECPPTPELVTYDIIMHTPDQCLHVLVSVHICVYICVTVCMCLRVFASAHIFLCLFTCVCKYIGVCVCVCVCVHAHALCVFMWHVCEESSERVQVRLHESVKAAICVESLCHTKLSIESVVGVASVGRDFSITLTGTLFLQAGEYTSVYVDNATGANISVLPESFFSAILLGS